MITQCDQPRVPESRRALVLFRSNPLQNIRTPSQSAHNLRSPLNANLTGRPEHYGISGVQAAHLGGSADTLDGDDESCDSQRHGTTL